ncbi:O-methyltransferase [Phascolomyces articulosus]|uniref:O-methyltransferase n=1 Tax=Phascolomyces articulosus TaxID=60185 RepID=A0AAD5K3D2_9FUNG|nr:O-methyltransferase [Phascolomyces articulosus]
MMIAETQGKMLHQLIKLLGVSRILEIGTFTGYSTLAMASALHGDNDRLVTLERDPKPQALAKKYIKRLELEDRIDFRLGPAMESLVAIAEERPRDQYDLVFIDADKKGYIPYYDFVMNNNLLSDRGIIVADNVLFFGQVHRIAGYQDDDTAKGSKNIRKKAKYAHEFNKHVLDDSRVQVVILPLFDGVSIINKKRV